MRLKLLPCAFAVCKCRDFAGIPQDGEYLFVGKTHAEISVVCQEEYVPKNADAVEKGWRGFYVEGELDFSLVGILAKISGVLAEAKVSIFALSTYDTDYVLVKEERLAAAVDALRAAGYVIE